MNITWFPATDTRREKILGIGTHWISLTISRRAIVVGLTYSDVQYAIFRDGWRLYFIRDDVLKGGP